ncbi:glycosyltransferase [Salinibacter altiplanensis]|uniref:glycosyltransferase n=1 Tax=Salinibacter altiplanensis TaxID=1803181 RepID=UPI0018E4B29A|nr:glycosyltransferase [Salinibacter altiplanensis]
MEDTALVNALQRRAAVVLQKSLREGFGLTVTEAMWKGTAVIGGTVGGIRHQVKDGTNGAWSTRWTQPPSRSARRFASAPCCPFRALPTIYRLSD